MSRDSWKVISARCMQRMEYKGDGGHNVKTGDETNVVLWFGLLAVSMAEMPVLSRFSAQFMYFILCNLLQKCEKVDKSVTK